MIDAIRRTLVRTPFPKTQLGSQLFRIARLLKASSKFGMTRPIFSATMAGFDTHEGQGGKQQELFGDLSQAMAAFYAATQELGLADQVVTYTQTEFNRTLRPNRMHGTEHALGRPRVDDGRLGPCPSMGGPDYAGTDGI